MSSAIPKKATWLKPVIPLEETAPRTKDEDERKRYITMSLKTNASSEKDGATYKKRFYLFPDGTPQEWVDILADLEELWAQNSVTTGNDRAASVRVILRYDSLSAFESALEEAHKKATATSTATTGTTTRSGTSTATATADAGFTMEEVDEALAAVTMAVFPHRTLEA